MSWDALGSNPVPGDEGAVLAIADRVRSVADAAEEIVSRLRGVDGGVGPAVWKGEAADVFRSRLGEVGPATIRLSDAHRVAHDALRRYADALAVAQQVARRAESAGQQALADRDDAQRQQSSAAAAKATATAQSAAVGTRVQQAQALRATATDPAYAAQLDAYLQQTTSLQQRAQAQLAAAHQAEQRAVAAVAAAVGRLTDARAQGAQAAQDCDAAAKALVSALSSVTPLRRAGASFWNGAVKGIENVLELGEGAARTIERQIVREYERGGKTLKRWAKDYGWLRSKLGINASDVKKVEGRIGWITGVLDVAENAKEQWAEDGQDPELSIGQRLFRAGGAGLLGGAASIGASTLGGWSGAEVGAWIRRRDWYCHRAGWRHRRRRRHRRRDRRIRQAPRWLSTTAQSWASTSAPARQAPT